MRDGNRESSYITQSSGKVFSLPMRDGNTWEEAIDAEEKESFLVFL